MDSDNELQAFLQRFLEARKAGENLSIADLTRNHPDLAGPLRALVEEHDRKFGEQSTNTVDAPFTLEFDRICERYAEGYLDGRSLDVDELLRGRSDLREPFHEWRSTFLSLLNEPPMNSNDNAKLPHFPGFHTIEQIGRGGAGTVYKIQDVKLRTVFAAKVVRSDSTMSVDDRKLFLEAFKQARVDDPHIAKVIQFHEGNPSFIRMEYVEGFTLGSQGTSLELHQYARIMEKVCRAIAAAHQRGVQHRDLKPSNILVDKVLTPKILDFGMGDKDPKRGHFVGTLPYMAPEQLDPGQPIDEKTDVYALGVILYELLAGRLPYQGSDRESTIALIKRGVPGLPSKFKRGLPSALERIALKAMARDPQARYPSPLQMAEDLELFLQGKPVETVPDLYPQILKERVKGHLDAIGEWLHLRLIHKEEHEHLAAAYGRLDLLDYDWIPQSRALTRSLIWLYFGVLFLICGSLLYFVAHRAYDAKTIFGVWTPVLVLAVPFVGLNAAGKRLYDQEQRRVAIACFLAAVSLLPLFLLIIFYESGWLMAAPKTPNQIFEQIVSNRQLQVTIFVACLWTGWLAMATQTAALATLCSLLVFLFTLACLGDFGLRSWLTDGAYHSLAGHLAPLVTAYAALGWVAEHRRGPRVASALYVGGALTLVAVLELAAQNGRAFEFLGISLKPFQPEAKNPLLLDTLAAMSLSGGFIYLVASAMGRRTGWAAAQQLLFALAPFTTLAPLGILCRNPDYSKKFAWIYLAIAVVFAVLSRARQRRSFYYAGITNAASALLIITKREEWFGEAWWPIAIVAVGLACLWAGYRMDKGRHRGLAVP